MKNRKGRGAKWCHCFASDNRENSGSQILKKISTFTLVEVTMTIVVITIGMMGIMALFPIGFQATKRAVGDNYSSELSDQFLNLVAMQCKSDWGNWVTGGASQIPTDKAGTATLDDQATLLGNVEAGGDQVVPVVTGIYKSDPAKGLYYVDAKSGSMTDFSAVMALWQEAIPYRYDKDGDGNINTSDYIDTNGDGTVDDLDASATIPNTKAVRLYLEVSWPASIPYKQREKRYYVRDVFNPAP